MSGEQPPRAQQQGRKKAGSDRHDRGPSPSGSQDFRPRSGRSEVYLHSVTKAQADALTAKGKADLSKNIRQRSGADVWFYPGSSPLSAAGLQIVIIKGTRSQIEKAVRLINEDIGDQRTISEQAEAFWLYWVQDAFPDLDNSAYFLPPVCINRVPMTRRSVAGEDVLVLNDACEQANQPKKRKTTPSAGATASGTPCVQGSDVKHDTAMERVLNCLQKMAEKNGHVLFGLSRLKFGQYLGEPCFAAATDRLPLPANLDTAPSENWRQGEFQVLLILRDYGLLVVEVKAFGEGKLPQQDVIKKLKEVARKLDKTERLLSQLYGISSLRITKTIAVPNLTSHQMQMTINADSELCQDLCRCLGTKDPADITSMCLCSDQLSDPEIQGKVTDHVLKELGEWWQRRVAVSGPDSSMTPVIYKTLVARFCGPATTVTVPFISPPRLCIKTLGQAVSAVGEFYAQIALYPEQVGLLSNSSRRVFLTGPPGTGKSVVLQLKANEWLQSGQDVHIVSTWRFSRPPCYMLRHLLQQTCSTPPSGSATPGHLYLLEYNLERDEDIKKAVDELSDAAKDGKLYIIVDEAGPYRSRQFLNFCEELLKQVGDELHLRAANCYHLYHHRQWTAEVLARPLRCPPSVAREVGMDTEIATHHDVQGYQQYSTPQYTDGLPVKKISHDHSGPLSDCVACGKEVAAYLHSLRVGEPAHATAEYVAKNSTSDSKAPPSLQYRDVVVLYWNAVNKGSRFVKELKDADIPVEVMTDDHIEDVATARSDVVWVANGYCVRGLERKVVVCLGVVAAYVRLHAMSRCTSQLAVVEYQRPDY